MSDAHVNRVPVSRLPSRSTASRSAAALVAAWLAALVVAPVPARAASPGFTSEKDPRLVELLAGLDRVGRVAAPAGPTFTVFLSQDLGACQAGHEARTCPRGELIVTAAWPGQGARVWRSPRRIGWQVDGAVAALPTGGVAFEAHACEARPEVDVGLVDPRRGGGWTQRGYRVVATWTGVTLQPLPGPATPVPCVLR